MNYCCDKKVLPAFTVLELLVGMIVSAIVLGTILSAWHIVAKQAIAYDQHAEHVRALSLGQSFLIRDCSAADSVEKSEGEIRCYQEIKGVFQLNAAYRFDENNLIRITTVSQDTFPLPDNHVFNNSISPLLLALFLPRRSRRYTRRPLRTSVRSFSEHLSAFVLTRRNRRFTRRSLRNSARSFREHLSTLILTRRNRRFTRRYLSNILRVLRENLRALCGKNECRSRGSLTLNVHLHDGGNQY